MAYYETVAQVIAVLFLALMFEAHAFDQMRNNGPGKPNPLSALTMLALLVLLPVGELAALLSLVEERDTPLAKWVTAFAVVGGGIGVLPPLWARVRMAAAGADGSAWLAAVVLFFGVGIGVVTLALLFG